MIRYQNFITVFAIFVHRWYLLKTFVLVTMYVTVVMVAARMSDVINLELMMVIN